MGRCKAPRRRRCGDIVEERQRRRCPSAASPRRAADSPACYIPILILRAGCKLESRQQNVKLFLREPLVLRFINMATYPSRKAGVQGICHFSLVICHLSLNPASFKTVK